MESLRHYSKLGDDAAAAAAVDEAVTMPRRHRHIRIYRSIALTVCTA